MKISKLKNAWQKIKEVYNIANTEHISLLDFKLYCYGLGLSGISSQPYDIKYADLPIDCDNFDQKAYAVLRTVGNCVKLFIKDTGLSKFTFEQFINYFNDQCKLNPKFNRRFSSIKKDITYTNILKLGFSIYNHRVVKLEKVEEASEVYDLKLDSIHNFALTCGLVVHNCGAL